MWSFGLTQVLRSSGKTSGEGPETADKAPKLMITGGAQTRKEGRVFTEECEGVGRGGG